MMTMRTALRSSAHAPTSARRATGGRPPRPFLSLAGFKEFVKPLALQGALGYRKWVRTGDRPPTIPARPELYYKHRGWVSWMDALSCNSRSRRVQVHAAEDYCYKNVRGLVAEASIRWTLEKFESLGVTADYEFQRLPRIMQGSFLVRRKRMTGLVPASPSNFSADVDDIDDDESTLPRIRKDSWKVLQVVSAAANRRKSGRNPKTRFQFRTSGLSADTRIGFILACPNEDRLDIVHLDDMDLRRPNPSSRNMSLPKGRTPTPCCWCSRSVDSVPSVDATDERAAARLRKVFERVLSLLPESSEADWFSKLKSTARCRLHFRAMIELREKLFQSAACQALASPSTRSVRGDGVMLRPGVAFSYVNVFGQLHNATWGGQKLLVRIASSGEDGRRSTRRLRLNLDRQLMINGEKQVLPMDLADGIACVVAVVVKTDGFSYENHKKDHNNDRVAAGSQTVKRPVPVLLGAFVFPVELLVRWDVFSVKRSGGRLAMTLYAPWSGPPTQHSRRQLALEQSSCYIDLTNEMGPRGPGLKRLHDLARAALDPESAAAGSADVAATATPV